VSQLLYRNVQWFRGGPVCPNCFTEMCGHCEAGLRVPTTVQKCAVVPRRVSVSQLLYRNVQRFRGGPPCPKNFTGMCSGYEAGPSTSRQAVSLEAGPSTSPASFCTSLFAESRLRGTCRAPLCYPWGPTTQAYQWLQTSKQPASRYSWTSRRRRIQGDTDTGGHGYRDLQSASRLGSAEGTSEGWRVVTF